MIGSSDDPTLDNQSGTLIPARIFPDFGGRADLSKGGVRFCRLGGRLPRLIR